MASRRSRLKAVANFPDRRKPVPVQQESDNSQNLKVDDDKTGGTVVEAEQKVQEVKQCEDGDNAQKQDNNQDDVGVSTHVEPGTSTSAVPSTDSPAPKTIKSPSASRFGRRIKPAVSIRFLKDRPSRERSDGSFKPSEKPVQNENHPNVEDVNSVSLSSSHNSENLTELKTSSQDVSLITTSENSQNDIVPKNNVVENIIGVNVIEQKENESQSQTLLSPINNDKQINNEDAHIFKSPVNNVKRNIWGNDSHYSSQLSQDAVGNKKIEESQSHNNPIDHFVHDLVSQSNPQIQCNITGAKRQCTTFKQKKVKYNDFARKVADARREFHKKYEKIPPDRSSLRMIDLIFYNPSTNPMESKLKSEKKDLYVVEEEILNESKVDDPEPVNKAPETNRDGSSKSEEYGKLPVPQVKIGLNGEIILDEKSLIIETTEAKKGREDILNSAPIYEDRNSKTCYYKRKTQKTRDWSDLETKRFYKALNTIGTDFSLMLKYFPNRSRLELKNKFKREEKLNRNLIDKVLNNPSEFDITQFEKYIAATESQIPEETEKKIQRKVKVKKTENRVRTKSSLLSREITESDENAAELDPSQRKDKGRMKLNEKSKQVNEINLLCEKYSLRGVEGSSGDQHSSSAIIFELQENGNSFNTPSRIFTNVGVNELNNSNKIRDAFDEIQTFNYLEKDKSRKEVLSSTDRTESADACNDNAATSVDEFYQAVVSLSASLKSDECKIVKSNRIGKRARANITRNEKKKVKQPGRKSAKKSNYPFMSTLDIETYESDCDNYSSSNESNDNSIISTKTITDQDFIKLLAANAKNMKESKIQFQITEGCSLEKNVEIILDNVPSITLNEI